MPGRKIPIVNGNFYHVFNRTIDSVSIFKRKNECKHFLNTCFYYKSSYPKSSFSFFRRIKDLNVITDTLLEIKQKKYFYVEIYSYCLMPNHFHFLLAQKKDKGISKFISNITNSYTRYYNNLHGRKGPLFLPRFKAVHIYSEMQLLYVSRYIHLNPYTSSIVKFPTNLVQYPWSSFTNYINNKNGKITDIEYILKFFNFDTNKYKDFVLNFAEEQKKIKLLNTK